jgi:hypothetical protein
MANTNNNTKSNNDEVNSSGAKLTEYKVKGHPISLFANYVDFAEDSDYYKGLKYFTLEDP